MSYFYGSLAVLGWMWTLGVVIAVVIWRFSCRPKVPGFKVVKPNEHQH